MCVNNLEFNDLEIEECELDANGHKTYLFSIAGGHYFYWRWLPDGTPTSDILHTDLNYDDLCPFCGLSYYQEEQCERNFEIKARYQNRFRMKTIFL